MKYTPSKRSKVKRGANRASYDKATLFKILDENFMGHLAYVFEETPIALPMVYARKDDTIYLHGATANRMLNSVLSLKNSSFTITCLDGLVLARSAFHHSVNYHSAVVFGSPREVTDTAEKMEAFECLLEQMAKGRWAEVRHPNENELKITKVIALDINEASAKIRQGPPVDDDSDYELPHWAGVVPLKHVYESPVPDPKLAPEIDEPNSVKTLASYDP